MPDALNTLALKKNKKSHTLKEETFFGQAFESRDASTYKYLKIFQKTFVHRCLLVNIFILFKKNAIIKADYKKLIRNSIIYSLIYSNLHFVCVFIYA